MLNIKSRRGLLHRKSRILLYLGMKDAIEKVRASGVSSFSRPSCACEYWRQPAIAVGEDISRHRKGLLAECADTNVLSRNLGDEQEDIDLRWNGMEKDCLRAYFFNGDCKDEMGNPDGIPSNVSYAKSKEGYDRAAESDGETTSIDCGKDADINNLTTFTLACLINPYSDGEANWGRICKKGAGIDVYVGSESGGKVQLYAQVGYDDTPAYSRTSLMVPIGEWSHLAITYAEAGDRKIHIYLNGAEASYLTQTASVGNRTSDAADSLHLLNAETGARCFDGMVDRLLLYDSVLSFAEIKRLALNGIAALWDFEDTCEDELGIHHGSAANVSYVDGETGRAAAILNSDSVVNVGQTPFLQNLSRFALRAKMKVPEKPAESSGVIAWKEYDTSNGWFFGLVFDAENMRAYGEVRASSQLAQSTSATTLSYGEWHEVAFSYDDYGDRKIHLWIDGSEVSYSTQQAAQGTLGSDANEELRIGNRTGVSRPLAGYVEHLVFYKRPLVTSDLSTGELLCWSRRYRPIIGPSGGNWDSVSVRDACLLMNEDQEIATVNGQYLMIYAGKGTSGGRQIGRALSADGIHWTKNPSDTPLLAKGGSGDWDEESVGPGTILRMNDATYRLYYVGRNSSMVCGLGLATSTDGVNFTKHPDNPLILASEWSGTGSDMAVAHVVKLSSGQYALVFERGETFAIYLGLSSDGISWTPANGGDPVMSGSPGEWDSNGVANPKLLELSPGKYLLGYNGQAGESRWKIGFAYSANLVMWTKFSGNPVMEEGPAEWDGYRVEGAFLAKQDVGTDSLRMWYFGGPDGTYFRTGYATCPQTSMDIFDMVDVTGWQKHIEPGLYEGHSVQLCESGGSPGLFYQVKTLTGEDYVVSFLAYAGGCEVTSADTVPFADTAFTNEISEFHYEHLGGGVYLCWGVFTATAEDWNVGVEVKGNKKVYVALLTCGKAGTSKASGPYARSPIANGTTGNAARQADSLAVTGSANFLGERGTLDIELYPLFPSTLSDDFELCFAHGYGGSGEIKLYRDSVSQVKFRVQGNGDVRTVTGNIVWDRGDRVKIRVVWDCQQPLDGSNYMLLYGKVNGGDWAQVGFCASQPTPPSSDQTLYVGGAGDSAGYEANSFISWLRIYDRALLNPAW